MDYCFLLLLLSPVRNHMMVPSKKINPWISGFQGCESLEIWKPGFKFQKREKQAKWLCKFFNKPLMRHANPWKSCKTSGKLFNTIINQNYPPNMNEQRKGDLIQSELFLSFSPFSFSRFSFPSKEKGRCSGKERKKLANEALPGRGNHHPGMKRKVRTTQP